MNARQGARRQDDPLADLKRQLKIKTGTFTRLQKEVKMYEQEVEDQRALIERMHEEGRDEADIKKQHEIMDESTAVILDTRGRLDQARISLQEQIETTEASEHAEAIKESDEWRAACAALGL